MISWTRSHPTPTRVRGRAPSSSRWFPGASRPRLMEPSRATFFGRLSSSRRRVSGLWSICGSRPSCRGGCTAIGMPTAGSRVRMAERGPGHGAGWGVVRTHDFERWLRNLDAERATQVTAALRRVARVGPVLGRPRVDSIKASRIHNLKELRVSRGVRVLFAFDPNRSAVMLVGGDKTGAWKRWYRQAVPVAERRYADHLRSIGKGNACLSPAGGRKLAGRNR